MISMEFIGLNNATNRMNINDYNDTYVLIYQYSDIYSIIHVG